MGAPCGQATGRHGRAPGGGRHVSSPKVQGGTRRCEAQSAGVRPNVIQKKEASGKVDGNIAMDVGCQALQLQPAFLRIWDIKKMGGTGKIGMHDACAKVDGWNGRAGCTARAGRQVVRRVGETEVRTYQLRDDACAGRWTGETGGRGARRGRVDRWRGEWVRRRSERTN